MIEGVSDYKIIVVGASAGGIEPIKSLVSQLPRNLNAAVFIVWHLSPDAKGILPEVLNKLQSLPAALAVDGETIQPGRIYIAPPDRHLLVESGTVRVTHGPKENRFRPAVDPLFRSAAYVYGSRVIGIILSGALDDGTAGLWTIKRRNGIAVVQEPAEALVPSMPLSAVEAVEVDYRLPIADMGALLIDLCNGYAVNGHIKADPNEIHHEDDGTLLEVKIALEEPVDDKEIFALGEPSKYTCPECHGVLTALKEGGRIRFRCHTGHAFSAETLLSALEETIENTLWSAVRGIEESKFLLNHLGDHYSSINKPRLGATYFTHAAEADRKAEQIRKMIHTPGSMENIEHSSV